MEKIVFETVENKQTDFADGDKVPYLITVTIPENINEIGTYTIKDTADPQLWLEPDIFFCSLSRILTLNYQLNKELWLEPRNTSYFERNTIGGNT
ncbi:hypothetical protein EfmAA290_17760 [Enterococcus faecium]|nr:hypothetical protein EfmAA290_17760 [Enterococcus faecium]